jgi:hypothetical protein
MPFRPFCGGCLFLIRNAVHAALTRGIRPFEVGGTDGTGAIARAVLEKL